MTGRSDRLLRDLSGRLAHLAEQRRFESAARARDRLAATVDALARCQRQHSIARVAELVLAQPHDGGWDLSVIRYGRLAAAGRADRGVPPMPIVDTLRASATTVLPPSPDDGPLSGAPPEEVALIARVIDQPGTRLVDCTDDLACPASSAQRWAAFSATARAARDAATDLAKLGA